MLEEVAAMASRGARFAIFVAAVAASGVGREARADVYVYRDANGERHFTMAPGDVRRFRPYVVRRALGRDRYRRFDAWILEAAGRYQVPEALLRAIIRCESDYDPQAVSPAGAQGLMQLMPETARRLGVADVWDPRDNILGGARLLRELANAFRGDLVLTVAAYNAGEAAVVRFGGVPPYPETRAYVVAVQSYFRRYSAASDPASASAGDTT
jgi:soluble lytic murein transglycosylase-like protein